jgi:hypothetical protein
MKVLLPQTVGNLNGPVVDNRLLDEAEERRPGTPDRPSKRERRHWEEARKAVGLHRQILIGQEHPPADFDHYRDYVLWQTRRFRESAGPDLLAVPPPPPPHPADPPPAPASQQGSPK